MNWSTALAGRIVKEILVDQQKTIGNNVLKRTDVIQIVKRVKRDLDLTSNRTKFDHKFISTDELVAEVVVDIEADLQVEATYFMISFRKAQIIVTVDLLLVKKSGSWVSKLL